MKVTLDLDQLLDSQKITQAEYERLSELAAKSTGSMAFNILIGFGVIAVGGAALALAPTAMTAILIGACVFVLGLVLLRGVSDQWMVLANICILVGALMSGGGLIAVADGSLASILAVTAIFAVASWFAKSSLLAVLATLMLSASIGARTGYFHASYFLVIQEPIITIVLFSMLSIGLYQLSKTLSADNQRISLASSRTGVFLVNFGFWVGSLWGDRTAFGGASIDDEVFAVLWAIALIATATWAWKRNRRWVLNTVATFGGIHFYTQWFENLGASPGTVLLAGLLALAFAVGLKGVNTNMKKTA
jgi:iron complex transport system permease protein